MHLVCEEKNFDSRQRLEEYRKKQEAKEERAYLKLVGIDPDQSEVIQKLRAMQHARRCSNYEGNWE